MNFEDFVAELNLSHFKPKELLKHTERDKNERPPDTMWGNIVPTILILDKLREHLEVPIYLTSVYRTPEYNATLRKAARLSQHQGFAATDISAKDVPPRDVCEILKQWQNRWFESPVAIESRRTQITVPAGEIPYAPLNEREDNGVHKFQFKGYTYYGETYVHIDTRGIIPD